METKKNKIYHIKHILGSGWIKAELLDEKATVITLSLDNTDEINFEKNDKLMYFYETNGCLKKFNSIILDTDFEPTKKKIVLKIEKPLERRSTERYHITLPLSYTTEFISGEGEVINISKTGFKIAISNYLEEGDYIDIVIAFTDEDELACRCKISYQLPSSNQFTKLTYTYGLEIVNISEEDALLLDEFIESCE